MEPQPRIDFQTDNLWAPGEAEKLKAAINARPATIYAVELDESLAPWGAKLMGHRLLLGKLAKRHNYQHCEHSTPHELN